MRMCSILFIYFLRNSSTAPVIIMFVQVFFFSCSTQLAVCIFIFSPSLNQCFVVYMYIQCIWFFVASRFERRILNSIGNFLVFIKQFYYMFFTSILHRTMCHVSVFSGRWLSIWMARFMLSVNCVKQEKWKCK